MRNSFSFIFIQQKTPTSTGGEMNAVLFPFQWVSKHLLNEDKASGGCHGIGKELIKDVSLKSSHPCDNG